jgi:O-antigen ligase
MEARRREGLGGHGRTVLSGATAMGLGLTQYIPFFVYIGVFAAVFVSLSYRLDLGLYFLIPLSPLQSIWFKLWDYPLGTNLIDILILAFIAALIIKRGQYPGGVKNFLPLLFLIVISFVGLFQGGAGSVFSAESPYLRVWKNFALLPLLYMITFLCIREERQMKVLIALMAFAMLANVFYFRSTFVFFSGAHYEHTMRISTFNDLGPNEMASFVAQGTAILTGIVLMLRHRWGRLLLAVVALANFYVIIYSFSRAAYLAVSASILFLALVRGHRLIIVLLLLSVFWKNVLPNAVVERIQMTQGEESELDHASQVRVDVWKDGVNTFIHNPLGVGFGRYRDLGFGDTGKRDAHNMYVKMLVETGAQGLAVYLLVLGLAARSGWVLYRSGASDFARGLGLGLVGCIIVSVICNFFGQDWVLFFVSSYYWVVWAMVERARLMTAEATVAVPSPLPA